LQGTPELRPEGFQTGDGKIPPRKAAGFIAENQKCMYSYKAI